MSRVHDKRTYTNICLVEALPKEMSIVVADALATQCSNQVTHIPLMFINPRVELVSLHEGSTIAHVDSYNVVANVSSDLSSTLIPQQILPLSIKNICGS